jgi:predicted secreted protein
MKSNPVSIDKAIGVYEPQTPSDCQPDSFTDSDDARRLVDNGEAARINRGKAIRLKNVSSAQRGYAVGLSARPSEELIERYVMATNSGLDQAAVIAVDAWQGRKTPSLSRQNVGR